MHENKQMKEGYYITYVEKIKDDIPDWRIAKLICINEQSSKNYESMLKKKWQFMGNIGVDTAQVGIFDNSIYPESNKSIDSFTNCKTLYDECCTIILGDQ